MAKIYAFLASAQTHLPPKICFDKLNYLSWHDLG